MTSPTIDEPDNPPERSTTATEEELRAEIERLKRQLEQNKPHGAHSALENPKRPSGGRIMLLLILVAAIFLAAFFGGYIPHHRRDMQVIAEASAQNDALPDVTVVADAGMISEANQKAIEDAGLSFILGTKIPGEPYAVAQWRREHPGQDLPDGHVFTQPWPATGAQKAGGHRDKTIYYQYRADRGRRTLRGIDEQVAKAEKAVAGLVPVKRNRFITLAEGENTVNRDLEAKARALAGLKGYTTNLAACPDGTPVTAEFVISAYHDLWRIEKSFRMSKHDLQARPVYHHQRESIDAHLTIVFAALAVSRWIEQATGWSIRKFVKTARRYRTIQIQAGNHILTAADPLTSELHEILGRIHRDPSAH